MLTEDYNGTCPKCGFDRMLVRYGSEGYYQYDACSKCGFAYGTNHYDGELKDKEVWDGILDYMKGSIQNKGLPLTRGGVHKLILSWQDPGKRMKSVFKYEGETKCQIG